MTFHSYVSKVNSSTLHWTSNKITYYSRSWSPMEECVAVHFLSFPGMWDKKNPSLVSTWDRKIPTRGPTVPMENEACRVSHWTVDPRVGIFLEPLDTNDRLFFSYTKFSDCTVQHNICWWRHWGWCLQSMTPAVQINLKQQINSPLNNEQMFISSKWIYKN